MSLENERELARKYIWEWEEQQKGEVKEAKCSSRAYPSMRPLLWEESSSSRTRYDDAVLPAASFGIRRKEEK